MEQCQTLHWGGRCCCNCKSHIEDYHHCTTVSRDQKIELGGSCVCSKLKGWICLSGGERAHSGWTEHGMCEMHEYIKVVNISEDSYEQNQTP